MTKQQRKKIKLKVQEEVNFDSLKFTMILKVWLDGSHPVDAEGKMIGEREFNRHFRCRLNVDDPKDGKIKRIFSDRTKQNPTLDIVTKRVSINAQDLLVGMVKKDLSLKRVPQVDWRYGENSLTP